MNQARSPSTCCGWVPAVVVLVLTGLLGGCGGGPEMPPTYPVQGKVTYQGGEPVAAGSVLFQAQADATVTTSGEIQPDGTFVLTTHKGRRKAGGAVAGPQRVIVALPSPDQSGAIILPKLYTVEARDNRFDFIIEKPRR